MSWREEEWPSEEKKIKDYFLLDTGIENMFINEYMATAPGDFVKVYLFAQMYAGLGTDITNEEIAKYLSLDHEDVLKAWTYWEKMGVVRKIAKNPEDKFDYDVEFIILKEQLLRRQGAGAPVGNEHSLQTAMADKDIQEMFNAIEKKRGTCDKHYRNDGNNIVDKRFSRFSELIAYGYAYCIKKKKRV